MNEITPEPDTPTLEQQIANLTNAVETLLADKTRRETETHKRIEALQNDILALFANRNTTVEEMYMTLEVLKHHLDEAYLKAVAPPLKLSDEKPASYTKKR